MKRLLSLATLAITVATLGTGAALANPHHGHHAMAGHPTMFAPHTTHRYGNDKARCRDAKGRFLKHSDARCLAR
ncbi:MAG: hypothetical protein NVS2B3_19210 [Vulcanimicrobiaceae bacterium]